MVVLGDEKIEMFENDGDSVINYTLIDLLCNSWYSIAYKLQRFCSSEIAYGAFKTWHVLLIRKHD